VSTAIGALIRTADTGAGAAPDELFARLYQELHGLAEHHLRRGGSELTLGTTTLLHEAYLNVAGREAVSFPDRSRFLAYASRAMRGLVIDYARRRQAKKRGGEFHITAADGTEAADAPASSAVELERLGEALETLAAADPALAELVDLHFFGGFALVEIAAMRQVSERTVQRDWRKARLLLARVLDDAPLGGAPDPA
jgi:RNA polymerase sigma factor (TIGR02999 family)